MRLARQQPSRARARVADKNKQEARVATVIVYLTSQSDAQGGHTIFPALPWRSAPVEAGLSAGASGAVAATSHDGAPAAVSHVRVTAAGGAEDVADAATEASMADGVHDDAVHGIPASPGVERYATAVRTAFARGRRALGCRDKGDPGCGDVDGVVQHAEAECERVRAHAAQEPFAWLESSRVTRPDLP